MVRHFILVGLFCCVSFFVWAQQPAFRFHPMPEPFSYSNLTYLYQSPDRWIWIGTKEGLFQYDGQRFFPFLRADSLNNHVTTIFQDSRQKLWVGYQDGSICWLQGDALQLWQPEEGLPIVPIQAIGEDPAGRIWLATYGEGLYLFDQIHLYNFDSKDGLLGEDLYSMVLDQEGRAWVGTDRGISICSWKDGAKSIRNITKKDGLPDDIVRSLQFDSLGNCWIGLYDNGFCQYQPAKDTILVPAIDWKMGAVNSLALVPGQDLWIGTDEQGLWRYDLQQQTLRPITAFPGGEMAKIYQLLGDQEGNIWGLSNQSDLFSFNHRFELYDTPLQKVQALLSEGPNRLWLGTSQGLYLLDLKEGQLSEKIPGENIISLYQDQFGVLWLGTFGEGVLCWSPTTGAARRLNEAKGLTNGSILSIVGTREKVWLATLGGVTELMNEQCILDHSEVVIRNYNQKDGLGTNFIYTAFVDSQQRVWFATDGEGLSMLNGNQFENYLQVPYLTRAGALDTIQLHSIYSIAEAPDGHIWFSTDRDGVFEFDGYQFRQLHRKAGIRNLAISSLVRTNKGQILIVHPSGIDLLNPEERHLIYYSGEVGLKELEPGLNAFTEDENGRVWIANQDQLILFKTPEQSLAIHPAVHLNQVLVNLEAHTFRENQAFRHDENHFIFHFSGLWYTAPNKVKFRYKLDGIDLDWIETRDQAANYSNLPPGRYTFSVMATENESWADEPEASVSFRIYAPFWQQPWFIVSCILGCMAAFYFIQVTRERRIRRLSLLEKEKVESQLAALKAQINPHFLFNTFNSLIEVIEENPQKGIEFVEKLSDFYRSILMYRGESLIPLEEEVRLIKDYAFLLDKRFGSNFQLDLRLNDQSGYLPPLTLQLLVENAIKHNVVSKSRPLRVTIEQTGPTELTISNNLQPKINVESSTHFGLRGLIERYELLGHQGLTVSKNHSIFRVILPLIENPTA